MSQVEIAYRKQDLKEFCLLEAQGSLETDQQSGLSGQKKFAEIKRLEGGKVVMVVGIHRVSGSVVPLDRPLAVLKRRSNTDDSDQKPMAAYSIQAIIKEKFLFKARPDVILQEEISSLPNIA
ncbi:Chromosome transmission fidelity protein 8 [Coemansia sp. RSA 1933]|nr:Chromosome transmission fidelity protein 8 [Coemansia sp. RSA 1933]